MEEGCFQGGKGKGDGGELMGIQRNRDEGGAER